ncbi:hypothetical protein MNBD_PLANCTO02-1561 [hydrothermal vent metagenome]|uniref:DUF4178 domain-containing protein n=1 Tax=hydrothermal vent metagenome TaxID=652676 RepID=A0A3B1DGY6_9ZZZZ
MKQFSCPSCGADITAQSQHVNLVICPSCQTSVLVDEKAVKISGKMSLLAVTSGPLFVKGTGTLGKRRFTVLGRVRYGYEAGFWDEWYLSFESGEFSWISEDELNYTFEKRTSLKSSPIDYASATPGDFITIGKEKLHIDEKGIAICEGAEGELPFVVEEGEKVPYLDLSSGKLFATLEYELDGNITLYHGRRLNLERLRMDLTAEEMGLAPAVLSEERKEKGEQRERVVRSSERSKKLNCFACGGTLAIPENPPDEIACEFCGTTTDLSLQACSCPHCAANIPLHGGSQVKSMVCPSCKMQVDVTRPDNPVLLESLAASKRPKLSFSIGQQCLLDELKYVLIGVVKYRQRDEGVSYFWTDFLLFNKDKGYRWLTGENGHFTLSVEIDERPEGINPKRAARKQKFKALGRKWRVFEVSHGATEIVFVDGELPWVAKIGDRNSFMDAIAPPYLLSAEWTKREMEWSLSEYKTSQEIAEAFNIPVKELRKPIGVAPCQPNKIGSFRKQAMVIMLVVFALNFFLMCSSLVSVGDQVAKFSVQPTEYEHEFLTQPFTVSKKNTICIAEFNAPVNNSWVYLDVAVIDSEELALLEYSADLSYYSGVEGGESWSEGSRSDSKMFNIEKPGKYRLLIKGSGGTGQSPNIAAARPVTITISQGVFPARYFIILWVFAFAWLSFDWWRRWSFETSRWGSENDDD